VARAKFVIGDPSYFPKAKTRATGRVVRSIVIMDHPVANVRFPFPSSPIYLLPPTRLER
jgi:hypothetical protein